MLAQLDLIQLLCKNRNYNACQTFTEVFPLNLLSAYILDIKIDEELKANFLGLVL